MNENIRDKCVSSGANKQKAELENNLRPELWKLAIGVGEGVGLEYNVSGRPFEELREEGLSSECAVKAKVASDDVGSRGREADPAGPRRQLLST